MSRFGGAWEAGIGETKGDALVWKSGRGGGGREGSEEIGRGALGLKCNVGWLGGFPKGFSFIISFVLRAPPRPSAQDEEGPIP